MSKSKDIILLTYGHHYFFIIAYLALGYNFILLQTVLSSKIHAAAHHLYFPAFILVCYDICYLSIDLLVARSDK